MAEDEDDGDEDDDELPCVDTAQFLRRGWCKKVGKKKNGCSHSTTNQNISSDILKSRLHKMYNQEHII